MKRPIVAFAAFAVTLSFGVAASAQSIQTLRGDIAAVDNATLHLKSSSGPETIKLPADLRVSLRVPAKLDDIKAGAFVGTAATPGPNGMLVASEVHIFPEAMRGTGEGHRAMPTMPGSTMTNATVSGVSSSAVNKRGTMTNATVDNVGTARNGRTLKLAYKGGEQTVFVSDKTPVVMVEAGSRESLTPGAHVIVYAQRDTSGDLSAQRISVGANGSVPPI